MANYTCAIRTNYFRVKDPDRFRAFMERVRGSEDSVELWEEKAADGHLLFGFGTYGSISGLRDNESDEASEDDYDAFLNGLQEHVAEDDAIIIFEAGREKLCYVVGTALIITAGEYAALDIRDLAIAQAGKMLYIPNWTSKCDY